MHIIHRQTCRVCGSPYLTEAVDLGEQHLQGSFVKEGHVMPPLRKIPTLLVRCDVEKNEKGCGLLQMGHSVPPDILYANYWYRSGTNATMRDHLGEIVSSAVALLGDNPGRVLDIGCNDGTLLANYAESVERYGVDPSDIARSIKPPVKVVNTTFPSRRLNALVGDKKFDIITSIAMYYDLESPTGFARAIAEFLAPNGIWIVEMSYLPLMLKQNSFDTICHEHLEYYSLAVLEFIARDAGLRVVKAALNDVNGGSIRLYLTKADNTKYDTKEAGDFLRHLRLHEFDLKLDTPEPYVAFQRRIEDAREKLDVLLTAARRNGQHIHVYGASTKGNVLLQWCRIGSSMVDCAADRNPDKYGARTLGTDIPIVSEEESRAAKPDYYLVLPWHFKAEFLERERPAIMAGTKMIFPLPEVTVVDKTNIDAEIEKARKAGFLAL
jgi:SAM-dependent methyltransferase